MLTIDMLKQNGLLNGLTDQQFEAIAEMSKNDENTTIGTRIGELHGQYDTDIFSITGIAKNQGEKSYDYAKRVLNDYKTKLAATATTQAQLTNANNEIERLKQQIANNSGDETLKQQLKDAKALSAQLQKQLTDQTNELTKLKQDHADEIKGIRVDNVFAQIVAGLKFKNGTSEGVKNILIKAAKAEVLEKGTPDFVDGENGTQVLVFRDKTTGNVINNPANNLKPFTAEELLMQTSIKDVLEAKVVQPGGGTGPTKTTQQTVTTLDLSGARTQVDADKVIESYLLSNGLTRDSSEFHEQFASIRTENNVSQLPLK